MRQSSARILCQRAPAWLLCVLGSLVTVSQATASAPDGAKDSAFHWPAGQQAAVSLAYDDALPSQLDVAIPQLDKANLKGSFYLALSAPTVQQRMADWRQAAAAGHELGNHSLFHQCAKSLPNRDWVSPERDLDTTPLPRLLDEVRLGNTLLQAIDGKTRRTFTAPCTDQLASGTPYLPLLKADFVAIKAVVGGIVTDMHTLDPYAVPVIAPVGSSGAELIAQVEQAVAAGTMVNFTFHGIGGDHLAVSREAHQQLLDYLARHRAQIWTAPFVDIMVYVKTEQQKQHSAKPAAAAVTGKHSD